MFTAEHTPQMNVDVPNVYYWTDNKWISMFQMFTAEKAQ